VKHKHDPQQKAKLERRLRLATRSELAIPIVPSDRPDEAATRAIPPEFARIIRALARQAAREDHDLEIARRAELDSRR
jgi:hypothetical protein